ncbi:MAG: chromate efflux transporter [Paracoccus sp. (in: a-proteobacteria)]|uniref:chromate efflux transporter n=1 Tax=Paracoccus sp. TaxID=267 RepID=UPI0026E0FAA3|nr:chromate efflux transporter [Paracoccus sp. (in: a-proteobacteria)]MDO5630376.1 chromate efflux transporter [Paracoccus sp. (in: a-proteobacteria)]
MAGPAYANRTRGTAPEVFAAFLKLGLTAFGGPVAHLGYFRDEFVTRRQWLSDPAYADLVALCQFLPGPASSQVGFALGLTRAGWAGAAAAFVAFTLPSALLLMSFALWAAWLSGPVGQGALHGLKIAAVAIVAQAVWGMARSLCPDRERAAIAVLAVAMLAFLPGALGMIGAIVVGGLAGLLLGRGQATQNAAALPVPVSRRVGLAALATFALLLLLLPMAADGRHLLALTDAFYRAGSLVFGGGHVVLPLLEAEVVRPGWVSADKFLAGYGAAQAVPGPLFTFAAYLGAVSEPVQAAPGLLSGILGRAPVAAPAGLAGATVALLAVFLPGFLLLIAALPFWNDVRRRPAAQSAMQGANAAVVGILGAALYSPVFTSAVHGMPDFALALACAVLLIAWKLPSWAVVIIAAIGGIGLHLLA